MQVTVTRMEPHRQVGNIRSQCITIVQEDEQELGVRSEELWLMALASGVGAEMERYAEERGWALSTLQIEAQEERNDEGTIMDIKLYVTAEGLTAPQRGEMFGAVRPRCRLLRAVHPNLEIYFADRLVQG
ncbi:OsmC family protein [Paenibacillus dendritiformis]|uniref:OsmC family protein n=1 Tax=Paenibacillus dendritiformis TaxID=130049 RepID=UPI00248AE5B4|nr:OsmC family protein [Paenibacillus dendritiformis]WGU93638.1 OsmC family protein [Paenibacillus dendritiformis]